MGDDDEEDEVQAFWREQAELPLFKRNSLWWIEVGLSNAVLVVIALAVLWFVLYGLAGALAVLI